MQTRQPLLRVTLFAALVGLATVNCGKSDESESGELVAPTELAAKVLPGPAVHLTWRDTPSEHHYSIERKSGAEAFKEVGTEVFNTTAYHDANVVPGTTYTYRIAGVKMTLEKGPYSSEVTITP